MALFESYERRIDKINGVLAQYGIGSVEECREICKAKGFDPYEIVKGIQPICFENACWAYTVGAAIALKTGVKTAAEAAEAIGDRPAGLLHRRLRRRRPQGRSGPRQPGRHAAAATRPSASPSWPVTSPSPLPKAPSASPATPTRPVRSPCGSS